MRLNMKQEVRILLGLLIFYLIYIFLIDSTALSNIPLIVLIGIFCIYLFLPDISNENNVVNKNQKTLLLLLIIFAIGVYLYTKLLLMPLIIVGISLLFIYLTTKPDIFKSISTGFYLSLPLIFINPFYFLFGFLGYLTFWLASRI
jgi:hypothetical protein